MTISTKRRRCSQDCATMARLDDLQALLVCLRGEIPRAADWQGVIALANRTLCSPAIATSLIESGRLASLPADVATFLHEMRRRNEERNHRLLAQLDEAARVLNAGDVQPILFKGSAWLACADPARRGGRMLADLDLMVAPEQYFAVIEQLAGVGYRLESPVSRPEVPAVLWRPQDAATIDLHSDYGSRSTLFMTVDDLARGASVAQLPGSAALLPGPAARVAILLLHDQLKGRDYIRGRIDLRHLLDLRELAEKFGEPEWKELNQLFAHGYARHAMRTQLLTARRLLGLSVPDELVRGVRARLQYRRRLVQLRWPMTARALTLLSLLDPGYLAARRASKRMRASRGMLPRRESVDRLFGRSELGKI